MRLSLVFVLAGCRQLLGFEEVVDEGVPEPVAACSTTRTVVEGFDVAAPPWWRAIATTPSSNTVVSVMDGKAIVLPGEAGAAGYFETVPFYDLRSSSFTVEVGFEGSLDDDSLNSMELILGDPSFVFSVDAIAGNALVMRASKGTLTLLRYELGQAFEIGQVPLIGADSFWRISELAGVVTWSTSSDGLVFNPRATFAVDVGVVRAHLVAFQGSAALFAAIFDNVNTADVQDPVCGASLLRDSFDGALEPNLWSARITSSCSMDSGTGELIVRPNGMTSQCTLRSATIYDLADGGITIELSQISTNSTVSAVLELPDDQALFFFSEGDINASVNLNLISVTPHDPIDHRFWRFRKQDDTLVWELSPDGVTFETFAQRQIAGLDRARLAFQFQSDALGGQVVIEGVNVPSD